MEKQCAQYLIEKLPGILCQLKQGFCGQDLSGLTLQQYRLMNELLHKKVSTTELSYRLAVSLPAISRMTQLLIDENWIEKEASPFDRRQITLSLTETGRDRLRQSREKYYFKLIPQLKNLSQQKKKTLIEAFQILDEFINQVEVNHDVDPINITTVRRQRMRRLAEKALR